MLARDRRIYSALAWGWLSHIGPASRSCRQDPSVGAQVQCILTLAGGASLRKTTLPGSESGTKKRRRTKISSAGASFVLNSHPYVLDHSRTFALPHFRTVLHSSTISV